jgi:hypothetical protein
MLNDNIILQTSTSQNFWCNESLSLVSELVCNDVWQRGLPVNFYSLQVTWALHETQYSSIQTYYEHQYSHRQRAFNINPLNTGARTQLFLGSFFWEMECLTSHRCSVRPFYLICSTLLWTLKCRFKVDNEVSIIIDYEKHGLCENIKWNTHTQVI